MLCKGQLIWYMHGSVITAITPHHCHTAQSKYKLYVYHQTERGGGGTAAASNCHTGSASQGANYIYFGLTSGLCPALALALAKVSLIYIYEQGLVSL